MAFTPDYLRSAGEVIGAAQSLRDAAAIWRARDPATRVVLVDAWTCATKHPHCFWATGASIWPRPTAIAGPSPSSLMEATALILTEEA